MDVHIGLYLRLHKQHKHKCHITVWSKVSTAVLLAQKRKKGIITNTNERIHAPLVQLTLRMNIGLNVHVWWGHISLPILANKDVQEWLVIKRGSNNCIQSCDCWPVRRCKGQHAASAGELRSDQCWLRFTDPKIYCWAWLRGQWRNVLNADAVASLTFSLSFMATSCILIRSPVV